MNLLLVSRALPPSLVAKAPLLLAEWCPVNVPDLPNNPPNQPLTLHATAVLEEIISPPGWQHGGIND